MGRSKNLTPTYRFHKPSGGARCWVGGEWVSLGKFNSPESRAEFARILTELASTTAPPVSARRAPALIIDEILLPFLRYAEQHYRHADGTPTHEVYEIKRSIAPLRELYGHTLAAEFGPRALVAVRQKMIDADWCRTLINRRMDRVKRAFKWAVAEEMVPVTVYQALRTVQGLQRGRTKVRESEPVKPVDPAHVAATLPYLDLQIQVMIDLQRLTGMRPGEVCRLPFGEVDRSAGVWLYRPGAHKTAHRGRRRVIPIGPKAKAVLVAFLRRDGNPPGGFEHIELNSPDAREARLAMAHAYEKVGRVRDAALLRDVARPVVLIEGCVIDPTSPVFSPAEARDERFRAMRAARKSKVPPSQQDRQKENPKRRPGNVYTVCAYGYAIRKAAKKAEVPSWHPNQLRHLFATEVRRVSGLEAAQVLLGHASADVTQVYAERDLSLAVRVAGEMG